jgi:hypothetical protein
MTADTKNEKTEMNTTTTPKLTGHRFTVKLWHRGLDVKVGDILFYIKGTVELTGGVRQELRAFPGRDNLTHKITPRGKWMGTSYGWAEYQMGRVRVVAELEREWEPRFQVRWVDESDSAFMDAALDTED